MDIADEAAVLEQEHISRSLAAARRRSREKPLILDGVRVCRSCEEPISSSRLEKAPEAVRCWQCQTMRERRVQR